MIRCNGTLSISTPSSLQILRISVFARFPISPLRTLYRYFVIQHTWTVIENTEWDARRYSLSIYLLYTGNDRLKAREITHPNWGLTKREGYG